MELRPFNISVLHVAPGAVKSNISSNGIKGFTLARNTLYSNFASAITKRIYASQGSESMRTREFSRQVVAKALLKNPPRYMSIGGKSRTFALLKWLPRGFVIYLMWRLFNKA